MAANEERVMREIVHADRTGTSRHDQDYAALFDSIVVSAKWPMRWLLGSCRSGDTIPQTFDDAGYVAAHELSTLGQDYSHFEAAFTYASLSVLTLGLDDRWIRASDEFRRDTRYDAYDRLRQPRMTDTSLDGVDKVISALGTTVGFSNEWFFYDTGPRLTAMALELLSPLIDSRFRLPDEWVFGRFSLDDFRAVARVLWTLGYLHFNARIIAAKQGCLGLGYARALYVTTKRELVTTVRTHTGLTRETVESIIETLTFGRHDQRNPDPALQPLIPLTSRHVALAPNLILNSALERNLAVLLNRLPEEKALYAALSKDREVLSRQRVTRTLDELGYRYWFGELSDWGPAAEIDLAIVSDAERRCLALEMKAFIGPADPREVHERSIEIKRGIEQATLRRARTRDMLGPLQRALCIDDTYDVTWAVASETSIGAPYVQSDDMPVVQTRHILDKLRAGCHLAPVCEWLNKSKHLPIEGTHYEAVDFTARVGEWNLPWYGTSVDTQNRPLMDT